MANIHHQFDEYVRINKNNRYLCVFIEGFDIEHSDPLTRRDNLVAIVLNGDIQTIPTLPIVDIIIANHCNLIACGSLPNCTNASFINNKLRMFPECPRIKRLALANNKLEHFLNIYDIYPYIEELDLANNIRLTSFYPTPSTREIVPRIQEQNDMRIIINPPASLTILQVQNNTNLKTLEIPNAGIMDMNAISGRNIEILDISKTKINTLRNLTGLKTLVTDGTLLENFVDCKRPQRVSCLPENNACIQCHVMCNFLHNGGPSPKIEYLRTSKEGKEFADEYPQLFTRSAIITDNDLFSKHKNIPITDTGYIYDTDCVNDNILRYGYKTYGIA